MPRDLDLLITGARVVDPATGHDGIADLGVAGETIAEVGRELSAGRARRVVDGTGRWLLPGLVDSHVHMVDLTRPEAGTAAHRRLALAGVTTAVEFASLDAVIDHWGSSSAGLTVLGLQALPAYTGRVSAGRIRDDIAAALARGAIGVKILGGHFPSTPEATAQIIGEAHRQGCYVAFHAGTTAHGSDLDGMREALELADGRPLHLAHTNAYLRGAVADPAAENAEALRMLTEHPQVVSETHLGPLNICFGRLRDGMLDDHIAGNCLRLRGYPPTSEGLRSAFIDGYAHAHLDASREPVTGPPALAGWSADPEHTMLSFPVNLRFSAYQQACARIGSNGLAFEGPGDFVVDAISSDGGLWRNVILDQGLTLVQLGALTPLHLAERTSLRPAMLFGLNRKGRLTPGSDADLVLVDAERRRPELTVARGRIIAEQGRNTAAGGLLLTSVAGSSRLNTTNLPHRVHDLSGSLFHTKATKPGRGEGT